MTTLIVGASGETGKLLVEQLLDLGHEVRLILRSTSNIPETWASHKNIRLVRVDDITKISLSEMATHVRDCQSVASCLGHNLSFKGIYGKPRQLVKDMVQLISEAVLQNAPEKPIRFVLMNTAGNSNRDLKEPISLVQKLAIAVLRLLLPPHLDNEKAADYLRAKIGQAHPFVEWVVVRPDSLIDTAQPSGYALYASPVRSALFNAGQTSRINVAHLIAQLITDTKLWNSWAGQMPVIYNDSVK